jgi:flagellar secretion chaperone FliS
MNATRRYVQSQNETASPERLMILLFEAALRHMRHAAAALEEGRARDAAVPLAKATDIVLALDATFDRARYPALAGSLGAVYRFTCERLTTAQARREALPVRDALRVFEPVADAFAQAVRLVAAEAPRAAP